MFVLDADTLTFVWAGQFASDTERIWATLKADQLAQRKGGVSSDVQPEVIWVDDGAETPLFVANFWSWPLFDTDDEQLIVMQLGRSLMVRACVRVCVRAANV